ncbi:hypothetical protein LEP1GSC195_2093 [Leptospira wolbachii serovar Codice str. CDC]|uniref:Uncharacterized protein n=1 Tax=Leptospira wolbachii serovar Codice str. CDC TaxID=1218599 RepID=R9A408_9LEPT|nr:hypothetical protein LEP1GSC195_2093 [Leptospira wolbachii serovar Codice str. CDC]
MLDPFFYNLEGIHFSIGVLVFAVGSPLFIKGTLLCTV